MKKEKNKKICSGRVLTVEQHFKENPQSIHVLNGNESRKGVMLNGAMIEIGSSAWNMIRNIPIYHSTLFNEISIIYHVNKNKK